MPQGDAKHRAKRANEHLKAVYAFTNTLGASIITVACIVPAVKDWASNTTLDTPTWFACGLLLHGLGHAAIRLGWNSED